MTALKAGELEAMEERPGYHQRSIAETAMYRFKQLIGPTLSLRNYNAQVGEILAGVKVMNKLIGLGGARSPASELSGINGLGNGHPATDLVNNADNTGNRSLWYFVGSYVFELCRINANQGLTQKWTELHFLESALPEILIGLVVRVRNSSSSGEKPNF